MYGRCPECGNWGLHKIGGHTQCSRCGWWEREDVVPETKIEDLYNSSISHQRVVEYKGFPFINADVLKLYEDYYDHTVGDIIRVVGPGGGDIFFEIAGEVRAERDGNVELGFLLIRVNPEDVIGDHPVIDVDPGEMALELKDAEEAAPDGGE